jgi:imidazolonepropionase-like amidohydrolase
MTTYVRCGSLFTARDGQAKRDQTLVYDTDGRLSFVGPTAKAPKPAPGDAVLDYSGQFVMPGLIDVHTHLAYGNAKSEEDIDLYKPLEFRALRGLFFAQKVLAAGVTSICSPGDAGQVSLAIRDAIKAGLFDGPRVNAAGPYITTRQSLTDWYPTWIGVPDTAIGRLVTNRDEAIEEIRVQVKNGVDCVKIALDGIQRRPDGELIAAFTQDETSLMVDEIHRMGRKAVVHAVGREATLYAARAGVDLIFHAYDLDDECIDAMLKTGSAIGPTLTYRRNMIDFTQAHEPVALRGRIDGARRGYETACANLCKAHKAGVPMMTGTDSGFAVTPYGEWHARELEIFVEDLGFTPAEALRAATSVNATFMTERDTIGTLEAGRTADFIALDGSPLENISLLLDKSRIRAVHLAGKQMSIPERGYDPRQVSDATQVNWTELYTQARVAELRRPKAPRRAAAE